MNWTGGSLKRTLKKRNLSEERIIQKQFFARKEREKRLGIKPNNSFNKHFGFNLNTNQNIHNSGNSSSKSSIYSSPDIYSPFRSKSTSSTSSPGSINQMEKDFIDNCIKRSFGEIDDQIFYKHPKNQLITENNDVINEGINDDNNSFKTT